MLKTLVPIDGSDAALRALRHVLAMAERGLAAEIHLLNVQAPIVGHARMFINHEERERYSHDQGVAALATARALLDDSKTAYTHHIVVGHVGETIVRFAEEQAFEVIVMGSRGESDVAPMLIGSVASNVIKLTRVPVTLVP